MTPGRMGDVLGQLMLQARGILEESRAQCWGALGRAAAGHPGIPVGLSSDPLPTNAPEEAEVCHGMGR